MASATPESKSLNEPTPTRGPKVSLAYSTSSARMPSTMVGWQKMPPSGSPTNPSRGLSEEIRPTPVEPCTVWCSRISSSHGRKPSQNRWEIIGPYSTSPKGSPTAAARVAASKRRRKSSWTDSCTKTVPREVQRWPAVPKPLNSAPSTARSRSASGMTTSGFLPPSSRHGFCRWRPASSPILRPTSTDPVNPTLSMTPAAMPFSSPSKVCGPSASTRFRAPSGNPPAQNSSATAWALAAAYSAGFQVTVLPHSSAGTRYQLGTATGKLPAVMIARDPTGRRKVNSCLSAISDGTVWPYRRRPSPRKKSQVSTISWTSPRASG